MEFPRKKNKFFVFFFRKVFIHMLKKNFFAIKIKNSSEVFKFIEKSKSSNVPVVFVLNHPNWWDAAVVIWLGYDFLKTGGYCIMENKQIIEHPFFLKIGAIPIVREDNRKSLMSLNFAASLLKQRFESLYLFPQGEITPNEKRDSRFYSGVSFLIEKLEKVNLVYIHLDYKYTTEQMPEIFINFFRTEEFVEGLNSDRNEFTDTIKKHFNKVNDEFREAYSDNKLESFEVVMRGKKSLDKKKLF